MLDSCEEIFLIRCLHDMPTRMKNILRMPVESQRRDLKSRDTKKYKCSTLLVSIVPLFESWNNDEKKVISKHF